MPPVKIPVIFALIQIAYRMILRDLLVSAIEDPNTEWDDIVLEICDKIFSYSK
ncbi:unnamed protein product [marine sediment metagenome]|uniref:Uncharacterized protein n=1 Tax=marine sediment metagenome TaxID=412755 RepID=X1UTB3_9ZZZZ